MCANDGHFQQLLNSINMYLAVSHDTFIFVVGVMFLSCGYL